jgi:hypothetical protein
MESETADNIAWEEYSSPAADSSASLTSARSRVKFTHLSSSVPLHAIVELVANEEERYMRRRRRLLVLTGRGRRMAVESHHSELKQMIIERGSHPYFGSSDSRKTVGDVATALIISENSAGVLVVQAADA